MAPQDSTARTATIFRPGENCAAVARSDRVAFIVDAEAYYQRFIEAAERAERSILVLAWDFDSRTTLGVDSTGRTVALGEFLNRIAGAKRGIRIRVLDWDYPMIFGTDREIPPTLGIAWKPHRRIDFRFDDTHPMAGSHHQKIVVIDDRIAFIGGLDLTGKRWDTPEHRPNHPQRVFNGEAYPPMHDVMIVVDGEAARAASHIARERWRAATGETLKPVKSSHDPWPERLDVALKDARVGIACTAPKSDVTEAVHQVEQLYLDMITTARDYIYIENQYFTSHVIADALAERLREPEGPEIVLVTRLLSHGWLEEHTMTVLRTRYVRELREADRHGRFHAFNPHVPGLTDGTCIDLHSKVMAVDDEWLRIGSSNLSNRSMGMDTECDAVVEAQGEKRVRRVIRGFRDCLLAEHLGVKTEVVAREVARRGTMGAAVESLRTESRCLQKLETREIPETTMAMAGVGDPEAPITFEQIVERIAPEAAAKRFPVRRAACILGGIVAVAIALALLWTYTPLAEVVTADNARRWAQVFSEHWWAPYLVVLVYTPASFVMFPRWVITMTAVIAFGPWEGFVYAMSGVVLAAMASYFPGKLVSRETVKRMAGPKLKRLTTILQQRGFIAVTLVRLVPVAPFPVVNLVMGAVRIKLADFVFGTMLGMLPGMLAATILSDQLAAALEDPAGVNFWAIGAALLTLAAFAYFGQRYLRRSPQ